MFSLVVMSIAVALPAQADESPPAPTIIWSDISTPVFIRGLTKEKTIVTIRLNGQMVSGVRYGASRGGTASFAVPWPTTLPVGVYDLTAEASRGSQKSLISDPLEIVVPGLRRVQMRPA